MSQVLKGSIVSEQTGEAVTGAVVKMDGTSYYAISGLDGTFDMVFIDVWANTYLNLFKRIEHLLHPGSIVLADNMYTAEEAVRPYKNYLDDDPRYSTTTLGFESGIEFTVVIS